MDLSFVIMGYTYIVMYLVVTFVYCCKLVILFNSKGGSHEAMPNLKLFLSHCATQTFSPFCCYSHNL